MGSLNDFFDDCEKEYSQQIMLPESDAIQEPRIKTRRRSLDTEKLKENAKKNADRNKERLKEHRHQISTDQRISRKSSKNESKSRSGSRKSPRSIPKKLKISEIKIESIPVKSKEFTLKNKEKIVSVIK